MSDAQTSGTEGHSPGEQPKPHKLRRIATGLAVALIVLVAYLLLWPSPIDPVAYDPPPRPPLDGPLAPNIRLESAELMAVGKVNGPEDVIVDGLGRVYTGLADGKVVRVNPDDKVTVLANTGG